MPVGAFKRRNGNPSDDPPAIAEATYRAAMNTAVKPVADEADERLRRVIASL